MASGARKPDRLERILGELAAEVESRREDDQTRLAEWFAGVLTAEHTKNERLLAFTEMLRRGPGEENEETEEND